MGPPPHRGGGGKADRAAGRRAAAWDDGGMGRTPEERPGPAGQEPKAAHASPAALRVFEVAKQQNSKAAHGTRGGPGARGGVMRGSTRAASAGRPMPGADWC
jgi:hypothetical protein